MDALIADALAKLLTYVPAHAAVGRKLHPWDGSDISPTGDLLAIACLNRSLQLTSAFHYLIKNRQSLAAAPLVRLQLDNTLRFSAIYLVDSLENFVISVIEGTSIRQLKDRDGKAMTDKYLVAKLSNDYDWLQSMYDEASGYVHLSEKHVFNAIQGSINADGTPRAVHAHIGHKDAFTPESFYVTLTDAFRAATDLFLEQVSKWVEMRYDILAQAKLGNNQ